MDFQTRADKLRAHPDTVQIEIAGESRPWFLGKLTFDLARARGVELGDVLAAFDGADTAGLGRLDGLLGAFGQLLFFGFAPFDEQLEPEDVTDLLSAGDLTRIMPQLMDALGGAAEDAAGKAAAAAQGAADRRKGR